MQFTGDDKKERMSAIGLRIKNLRKQLGYKTQEELACATNTTRVAIASYEIGRAEPTAAFLQNLSMLGVDTNYILTGKSEQELPDLDAYLSRLGIDEMMKAIIKGYMKLPESKRKTVRDFIESLAAEIAAEKANPPTDALPKSSEPPQNAAERQREPPAEVVAVRKDSDKPEGVSEKEWAVILQMREQEELEKISQTSTVSRSIA